MAIRHVTCVQLHACSRLPLFLPCPQTKGGATRQKPSSSGRRENSALTLCSAGLPPGAAATSTASSSSRPSKRGPATWHDTLPAKRQAREQARREAEQAEKADALAKAKALLAKPLPHRRMAEPEKKARAEARRPVRACVVRKF